MKKLLLFLGLAVAGFFCTTEAHAFKQESNEFLNLTDTVVFDLSAATYSNAGGVFYIDIPVLIYSNNPGINALDFWFQFNLNKLTYVSTVSLESGLDPFTNYNVNSQVLSNTTSGTSITYSAPLYTELLMLRFSLANACTEIFPTDFTAVTALVNGNVSSYLFIEPAGMPPFEIQQPQPYCSGNEIIFNYPYTSLNGRQILFYSWDFGNGQLSSIQSDTTVYATEGDYPVTLSVTTVDGCIYSQQHVIPVYPTPVAAFTSSYDAPSNVVSFTNESSISSGSINIYLWNFGTSTSNLQSPNYTFPAMGFYDVTLTATSDLGCTSSITQLVSATDNIAEVSLRTLNLFPNPTSNFIQIESSFHTNVRITDAVGRILTENYILQTNQVKTIDVSLFPSGVYFLECVETENMLRKRFVIQK
jgi:hypothetical protein